MTRAAKGPDLTHYPRDPRVMPRPGDTVTLGTVTRRVTRFQWSPFAKQWFINYKTGATSYGCSLAAWQIWARKAVLP